MRTDMSPKSSRIHWRPEEWSQMLSECPELATTEDPLERMRVLQRAQTVLPEQRQRTYHALYDVAVTRAKRLTEVLEQAVPLQAEVAQQPQPSITQMEESATDVVGQSAPQLDGSAPRIRWAKAELIQLAHDSGITPLLDKSRRTPPFTLVEALLRVQAVLLPQDRWRTRANLTQACYGQNNLFDRLRDAMRYPPIPKTQAALPTPEPVQAPASVAEVAHGDNPAPAEIQPAAAQPLACPTLPKGIEDALDALCRANNAVMLAFMQQVRTEMAGAVRDVLREAIQGQADSVREGVRDTIMELLGGPSAGDEPPRPDFKADMQAEQRAQEALARFKRPRVDVVGLLNGQADLVKKACGSSFDLRFLTADESERQQLTAPVVIMLRKFVNHSTQERIRKAGANLVYANGGPESVIKCLNELPAT